LIAYNEQCGKYNPDLVIIGYVLNDAEGEKTAKKRKDFLYTSASPNPRVHGDGFMNTLICTGFIISKRILPDPQQLEKRYDWIYADSPGYRETQRTFIEMKRLTEAQNSHLFVALLPLLDYELTDRNIFSNII